MSRRNQFLAASLGLLASMTITTGQSLGQVIETVTFENVSPDVAGSGDFRSYPIAVGGDVRSIDFEGQITEINTSTFISEVIVDIFGAGNSLTGQRISRTSDFTGTAGFSGNILVDAATNLGDLWSFIFREDFDDGGDGLADAVLDITFSFLTTAPPPPTVSDLGSVALNQGTYPRGGSTGEFAYSVVPIEVSQAGTYTLDVEWFDAENATSFDGYLYLLDSPFAGSEAGEIASNDDSSTTAFSQLDVLLEPNEIYYALLTTFSPTAANSNLLAQFSASSTSGGTVRSLAVPEPGGLLYVFATGILARRRRGSRI